MIGFSEAALAYFHSLESGEDEAGEATFMASCARRRPHPFWHIYPDAAFPNLKRLAAGNMNSLQPCGKCFDKRAGEYWALSFDGTRRLMPQELAR